MNTSTPIFSPRARQKARIRPHRVTRGSRPRRLRHLRQVLRLWLALFSLLTVGTYVYFSAVNTAYFHNAMEPLTIHPATRLLILAPHNDDEILNSTVLIQRVLAGGGAVRVVLFTCGDGSTPVHGKVPATPQDYYDLGVLRQHETLRGLAHLGLARQDVNFLGYPDGGLAALWGVNRHTPYFNPHSQTTHSPYPNIFAPKTSYCGENVTRDLRQIAQSFAPTLVLAPDPNDTHPDHAAVNWFANEVLAEAGVPMLGYLVHFGKVWPMPAPAYAGRPLTPPPQLRRKGTTQTKWYYLSATPAARAQKRLVLDEYQSQLAKSGPFLRAFNRENELFSALSFTGKEPSI